MTSGKQDQPDAPSRSADEFDAVVVGAGFSGLYMLHRLRDTLGLSARVFEAADDVGGTWYFNRYPGARCDSESYFYSFSDRLSEDLLQEWTWSERYAAQPELLSYLRHVADRFDLRKDITFGCRVTGAAWDDESGRWHVTTATGELVRAQFLIMAAGCLSVAKDPEIPGAETFGGPIYHNGHWPHGGAGFTGQRLGVIGTGSSGIQSIPILAGQARDLTVFQHTRTSLHARAQPAADAGRARRGDGGVPADV